MFLLILTVKEPIRVKNSVIDIDKGNSTMLVNINGSVVLKDEGKILETKREAEGVIVCKVRHKMNYATVTLNYNDKTLTHEMTGSGNEVYKHVFEITEIIE
jgi:hypothetical protein